RLASGLLAREVEARGRARPAHVAGRRRRRRLRDPHESAAPRASHLRGAQPAVRAVPAAVALPVRTSPDLVKRSTAAELALVGIAAVWGLTFTMGQDASAILPTLSFLAYRFAGATLLVAPVFWRRVAALSR